MQTHLDDEMVDSMVRLSKALSDVEQHVYNLYLMSYTGLRGTSSAHSLNSAQGIRGVRKIFSVLLCLLNYLYVCCVCMYTDMSCCTYVIFQRLNNSN